MSPGQHSVDQVSGERGTTSITRVLSAQSPREQHPRRGPHEPAGFGRADPGITPTTLARQGKAKESAQAASVKRAQGDQPLPSLGRIEQPGAVNVSNAAAKSADPQDPLALSQERILMDMPGGAGRRRGGGMRRHPRHRNNWRWNGNCPARSLRHTECCRPSSAAYLGGAAGDDSASFSGASVAGGGPTRRDLGRELGRGRTVRRRRRWR